MNLRSFFPVILLAASVATVSYGQDAPAPNQAIVLDFEGLQPWEAVGDFFNGGTGGEGSGPGPSLGIQFAATAFAFSAVIDGELGGEPVTGFSFDDDGPGNEAFLNVSNGFDTGFSFFYWSLSDSGVASIFSGSNGTGNLLATIELPMTQDEDLLVPIGVGFSGTARSVVFNNVEDLVGFDNLTFGSVEPISDLLLGDVNLDGVVDFFDIAPFIMLLSSGEFQAEADINIDGEVDFFDIEPFIQLLSGQ